MTPLSQGSVTIEFIDTQGIWCLIINSCAKEGKLSAVHKDSSGKENKFIKPMKVVPRELTPLGGWSLGQPLGLDRVTVILEVGEQKFSGAVTYKVK